MSSEMLGLAQGAGISNVGPNFALSRIYSVIAKGVVTTLTNPAAVTVTVTYVGKPCIGLCVATANGVLSLDPSRYQGAVKAQTGFTGPYADPFFLGISGIVSHFLANVLMTDPGCPIGPTLQIVNLVPGGMILDSNILFNNMKLEAVAEDIMVVNAGHGPGVKDPTTGATLGIGDLFIQAEILLQAVAQQLAAELLFASQSAWIVAGADNPTDPSIAPSATTTTLLS